MKAALLNNRFKLAEHVRQYWHVTPRPEDSPEEMLDPMYWVHVARNMKIGDRIEAVAETREWFAEAIVLDVGSWGAKISFIHGPVKLTNDAEIAAPDEYDIKWAGPTAKFRVIRKSDNKVLKEGNETKEAAAQWVKGHKMAMAA